MAEPDLALSLSLSLCLSLGLGLLSLSLTLTPTPTLSLTLIPNPHQALEYGGSVHPVTLLCPQLRARRGEEVAAQSWLMVVDQYGNLHSPSGTARAMLVETGWAALRVLIHDAGGEVQSHTASELAPMVPRLAELLGDGAANGTRTNAQKRAAALLEATE